VSGAVWISRGAGGCTLWVFTLSASARPDGDFAWAVRLELGVEDFAVVLQQNIRIAEH